MLRLSVAAQRLGIHPQTLRLWADSGRVPVVWVGSERRFREADLDAFLGAVATPSTRREVLYVRVSGTSGQETSLATQEQALRDTASGEVVAVYRDRASGLREDRPGLRRLLEAARAGAFTVVRVTHEDRLARYGAGWLREILARDGVTVADFMSLVATFAGRMYGIRSREARQRLLRDAGDWLHEPCGA
ncbi:IS607 family transposase [Dactylosporangium sp. CA-139066]|uniref:IS607 family transposase n=1 Tax=Dactylosporangium sp. CA-139066 TaxID=3239930 RepID=UPI003D8BCC2F